MKKRIEEIKTKKKELEKQLILLREELIELQFKEQNLKGKYIKVLDNYYIHVSDSWISPRTGEPDEYEIIINGEIFYRDGSTYFGWDRDGQKIIRIQEKLKFKELTKEEFYKTIKEIEKGYLKRRIEN